MERAEQENAEIGGDSDDEEDEGMKFDEGEVDDVAEGSAEETEKKD